MIFSENRYPLFGIMLCRRLNRRVAVWHSQSGLSTRGAKASHAPRGVSPVRQARCDARLPAAYSKGTTVVAGKIPRAHPSRHPEQVMASDTKSRAASSAAPSNGKSGGAAPKAQSLGDAALSQKARQQVAAMQNSVAFTQIVGVMMRSQHYRTYTLADLEWLLVPALLARQYRIGQATAKDGMSFPVAVVLWASVSAEVDRRLAQLQEPPVRLQPAEWTSGDILWLAHAAGEPRFVRHLLKQLSETAFKGREVRMLGRTKDGKPAVHVLPASAPAAPA
jgi:hemolysin-activating ACP:hemolysin acyltransferase